MKYTITDYRCPNCGKLLKRRDEGWGFLLSLLFFPLLLFVLPFCLSYLILNNAIFKVDIPHVGNETELKETPNIKVCPKCKTSVKIDTEFKATIKYEDLNDDAKKEYDNRWWFMAAYILGGFLILCIAFSFFLVSSHPTDKIIGTTFLCLAPVFLLAVIGIVFRWKRISVPNKLHTTKYKENSSITNELKQYKELLDSGIITQEEFDNKKKQILDL